MNDNNTTTTSPHNKVRALFSSLPRSTKNVDIKSLILNRSVSKFLMQSTKCDWRSTYAMKVNFGFVGTVLSNTKMPYKSRSLQVSSKF